MATETDATVRTEAAVTASPSLRPTATRTVLRTVPHALTRPPLTAVPELPGRQEMLSAFREIAFTSEYRTGADSPGEIRKWTGPLRLAVHGSPAAEDMAALQRAMDGLNALAGFPGISLAEENGNAVMWFVKLKDMADAVPGYVEGNWGFFTVSYNEGRMSQAAIAIATDVTDQAARTHLIYEELLQSTGLMQDQYTYPESIFYGQWTTTPEPTPMDWELLRMLYMKDIMPGMSEKDAMAALEASYQ